jgi:hypothetical protein
MIRWWCRREAPVVGSFGCVETGRAATVSDRHAVDRSDQIGVDDVVPSDTAYVRPEDGSLDTAACPLSLMGSNETDCLREARRTQKLGEGPTVIEATWRFGDPARHVWGPDRQGSATWRSGRPFGDTDRRVPVR